MIRLLIWNTKEPNTAGICRLADAFAVDRIAFVRRPKSWTPAVGTQGHVPMEIPSDPLALLRRWSSDGYAIVAVEQADTADILPNALLPEHAAFVLGNEGGGVPESVLSVADQIIEIPQWGPCCSLNVAVAGGIVLYEWARQWRTEHPRSYNAWRKRHGFGRGMVHA